jgi:predicted N-acetyltransferase YhbS
LNLSITSEPYTRNTVVSPVSPRQHHKGNGVVDQARMGRNEPLRTETGHERRGIASHLLAVGLDRLAANGCGRLKVANDLGIYLRVGFRPLSEATAAIYSGVNQG